MSKEKKLDINDMVLDFITKHPKPSEIVVKY